MGHQDNAPIPYRTHNEVRDKIARDYFDLPPLRCRFCGYDAPLPKENVGGVVTEYHQVGFRADVAALDVAGREAMAVIEVIHTHPPSKSVFAAQAELPTALYVTLDAMDGGFSGYCSEFCWTNQNEKRSSRWRAPKCDDCGQYFHEMEFQFRLHNWNDPNYEYCIECAAKTPCGKWRAPFDFAMDEPSERIPGPDATVLELFLSFSDADFWAMVWENRVAEPKDARNEENDTRERLNRVEAAFNSGNWNEGYLLLQPIGAPAWDRPEGPSVNAFQQDNCLRTAKAWRRLWTYRLSCLPPSIQAGIRSRPIVCEPDVCGPSPASSVAEVTHRGLPDGRWTACCIDRDATDEFIRAKMRGEPTCEDCKTKQYLR